MKFRKINLFVCLMVLFSFLNLSISSSFAQADTTEATVGAVTRESSYILFWPIVAGQVKGDSLYFLKSLKENLREKFIFNDLKKAEYYITLSEKRVVEAEKLFLDKKDPANAAVTLAAAADLRSKTAEFIKKAKDKNQSASDVENSFKQSLTKQRALLQFLDTQVSDGKDNIEKNIDSLNAILTKLD